MALLSLALGCTAAEQAMPARVDIGLPAPAYVSQTLNGDSVSLASLKDRVVLLNVWATWCHPCRTEIPELRELHARYKDRGLELVGVSVDAEGNEEGIREFMKEFDMQYPVWRDPSERVSTQFLVIGVPRRSSSTDRESCVGARRGRSCPMTRRSPAPSSARSRAEVRIRHLPTLARGLPRSG